MMQRSTDDFFEVNELVEMTGFTRQHLYMLIKEGALERYELEKSDAIVVTGTSVRDWMLKRVEEWSERIDHYYRHLPEAGLREQLAESRKALQAESA